MDARRPVGSPFAARELEDLGHLFIERSSATLSLGRRAVPPLVEPGLGNPEEPAALRVGNAEAGPLGGNERRHAHRFVASDPEDHGSFRDITIQLQLFNLALELPHVRRVGMIWFSALAAGDLVLQDPIGECLVGDPEIAGDRGSSSPSLTRRVPRRHGSRDWVVDPVRDLHHETGLQPYANCGNGGVLRFFA